MSHVNKHCSHIHNHYFNSLHAGYFFMLSCHLLTFFKINFIKNYFKITIRKKNGLAPDHPVSPDLGLNSL